MQVFAICTRDVLFPTSNDMGRKKTRDKRFNMYEMFGRPSCITCTDSGTHCDRTPVVELNKGNHLSFQPLYHCSSALHYRGPQPVKPLFHGIEKKVRGCHVLTVRRLLNQVTRLSSSAPEWPRTHALTLFGEGIEKVAHVIPFIEEKKILVHQYITNLKQ